MGIKHLMVISNDSNRIVLGCNMGYDDLMPIDAGYSNRESDDQQRDFGLFDFQTNPSDSSRVVLLKAFNWIQW